jgi:hypothetical protein
MVARPGIHRSGGSPKSLGPDLDGYDGCSDRWNDRCPTSIELLSRSASSCALLFERIGKGTLTRRAFFHGQDGAPVVVVDHRNVEPAAPGALTIEESRASSTVSNLSQPLAIYFEC